jgi:hypothetical protein
MADLAGGAAGWLARWWRRREEAPQSGGVVLPVDRALALLEMQVCEGLAQRPPAPPTAQHAGRLDVLEAPRNAFGRHVLEETASGPQQAVALAAGMALSGLRASVFLESRELSAAREGLSDCAERLLPLVVHAAGGSAGHGPYHALAESGLFQALAGSGQEALDLCLVARWLAERALLPGLVASDGHAYQRLELPDAEATWARPTHPWRAPARRSACCSETSARGCCAGSTPSDPSAPEHSAAPTRRNAPASHAGSSSRTHCPSWRDAAWTS